MLEGKLSKLFAILENAHRFQRDPKETFEEVLEVISSREVEINPVLVQIKQKEEE